MMAGPLKAFSGYNYFGLPYGIMPVVPTAVGKQLYCQAVWADSGSGAMKASTGTEIRIPPLPRFLDITKTRRVSWYNPHGTVVYASLHSCGNPIMRYN